MAPAVGRLPFDLQRGHVDGRRDAVERHVHECGDAAGRGRPRGGGEALPLGVARLANVDVAVDEPRQEYDVVVELQSPHGGWSSLERLEGNDAAAVDRHCARLLPGPGQDRPLGRDDEVERLRHG